MDGNNTTSEYYKDYGRADYYPGINIHEYIGDDEYWESVAEYYYSGNSTFCESNLSQFASIPSYRLCIHILLPIICTVGIVGILLTVIVLSRKNMSTSTNCYLTSLAIADLCFLIILSSKCFETKLSREHSYMYAVIMTYTHVFLTIFIMASVWLTVMLAVERYIAICHPLRAMSICTVVRAKMIIVGIFIIFTAFRIPVFFNHRIVYFHDHCIEKDVIWQEFTAMGRNRTFHRVYSSIDCLLSVIIPFSALFFLNVCLIVEIRRSTNYLRYHLASDSNVQTIITSEEIKITMMLISVIVVFFVCQAPYVILSVAKNLAPEGMLFPHYHLMTYITILLLVLRSSFNFVLYCWFSEKFWSTFKLVFCRPACILSRVPSWFRSRVIGNNSEHGFHSNSNNNRKISNFHTKETFC